MVYNISTKVLKIKVIEKQLVDQIEKQNLPKKDKMYSKYNFKTVGRLAAIQSVYAHIISKESLSECSSKILKVYKADAKLLDEKVDINTKHYAELIGSIGSNLIEIKETIQKYIKTEKNIDDFHILLSSILITATAEIIYLNTPLKILLNEFTNIASSFLLPNEVNFVNSILDKIGKDFSNKAEVESSKIETPSSNIL